MQELLAHVLGFYVAFGLMAIGFGFMFAGKAGGKHVAELYFAGSVRWTLGHVWRLFSAVLASLWSALVLTVGALAQHLWRGLRWLFTHERGPARARNAQSSRVAARIRTATTQLAAAIKRFGARYIGLHSLAFLLCLLCGVVASFVVCFVLLRRVLGW